MSSFRLFCLDLQLFTQSVCIEGTFSCGLFLWILVHHQLLKFHILYSFILEIYLAPSRKQRCYFSHGPPCTLYFQGVVCSKPGFLMLICHFTNSMSKIVFLKKVLYLWSTIQIRFRKYKVFWIMLVDFKLSQNFLPETHLQIQPAPLIEVATCFFYGAPCTQHFHRVKCHKSFLLGRICGEQSLVFSVLVFHLL